LGYWNGKMGWDRAQFDMFGVFEAHGFKAFRDAWISRDVYAGKQVMVTMGSEAIGGVAEGIDARGGLLLKTPEGVRAFYGGEVSLG
jgi:BirA family biotin operon repressor/biotin-[acetyl-CoA-carboxylase] ligase